MWLLIAVIQLIMIMAITRIRKINLNEAGHYVIACNIARGYIKNDISSFIV